MTRPILALMLIVLLASPLAAQYPRPALPAAADTSDWEAYFDHGVRELRRHPKAARAAFWWAGRLDPTRAEPPFGEWVAFWVADPMRYRDYLAGEPAVISAPDVIAVDSLRYLALIRNPFVHQGLEAVIYDVMPGRFAGDRLTKGFLAYAEGQMDRALSDLARGIERDPRRYVWFRYVRAQAIVVQGDFDRALEEMNTLLAELERREEDRLVRIYQSKELIHFAIAHLHAATGRPSEARGWARRALVENLGFYPAHALLGVLDRGRPGEIVGYEAALDLRPEDPTLHYAYAQALLRARRREEAAASLRRALALEPHHAAPLYELGQALQAMGDDAGAAEAYATFLARSPRNTDYKRLRFARTQLCDIMARSPGAGATAGEAFTEAECHVP